MRGWIVGVGLLVSGCQWVPGTDEYRTAEATSLLRMKVPEADIHRTWLAGDTVCGHFRDPTTNRIALFFREPGAPVVVEPEPVAYSSAAESLARTAVLIEATKVCFPGARPPS